MISKPHALYYNGELIGIITNPDPHGNINTIVEAISPDNGLATAIPIPRNMGNMETWGALCIALVALGVEETIELEDEEEDENWCSPQPGR